MAPFDRLYMISYYSSIVTLSVRHKNAVTLKTGIRVLRRSLTVFTFVACGYKYICISRIVTQNTLKCAISRAKFQKKSRIFPDLPH